MEIPEKFPNQSIYGQQPATDNFTARSVRTHYRYCNVEPVFGGLWARNVSIGRRAVVTRRGDMKSYSQYEAH